MQYQSKQIMTAKSQVQVINGFFLKETHKLSDTIDYLVTMTKVITASAGDLHVIPSRYLSRTTYASLQTKLRANHTYPFLTSYEAFQELNKKSNLRTTREYLARMLLVIKGMSPERVGAMLDVWETPRELYEAMKARYEQGVLGDARRKRGPEFMFADMVPGEGRRKIGDALSKAVSTALMRSKLTSDLVRNLGQGRRGAGEEGCNPSKEGSAGAQGDGGACSCLIR